jgi:hypothetical protein
LNIRGEAHMGTLAVLLLVTQQIGTSRSASEDSVRAVPAHWQALTGRSQLNLKHRLYTPPSVTPARALPV